MKAAGETYEISEERVERCLAAAAFVVVNYRAAYAPLFERLEHELEAIRQRRDPIDRAKLCLRSRPPDV